MSRMQFALPFTLLTLALAACAPTNRGVSAGAPPMAEDPAPMDNSDAGQCNVAAARWAIGKPATSDVVTKARTDAGAAQARVLKPGQMVTMEYHPSRLNIDVDAANVITNVRCG